MYQILDPQSKVIEPAEAVSSATLQIVEPKTSFFDKTKLTINSVLADLPVHHFQVDVTTPAVDIDHTFRHHREIPGVLIMQDQVLAGIISRRKFFEYLGQLYGTAVYLDRPIDVMLKSIGTEWLHLPKLLKMTSS